MNRLERERLLGEWEAEMSRPDVLPERRSFVTAAYRALEKSATMSREDIKGEVSRLSGKDGTEDRGAKEAFQFILANPWTTGKMTP